MSEPVLPEPLPISLPLPRFGLALLCLSHAALFGLAAAELPWRSGTTFALTLSLLALLHAVTAGAALLRRRVWLLWTWRALAIFSGLAFLGMGWALVAAALYVSQLYLRLGAPVAAAIVGALVLLALLTLPIAVWGALCTAPRRLVSARRVGISALVTLALASFGLSLVSRAAHAEPALPGDAKLSSDLGDRLERYTQLAPQGPRQSVAGAGPAVCELAIAPERLTLLVAYANKKGQARSACLQAEQPRILGRMLEKLLQQKTRWGSTVVVDLVKATSALDRTLPLFDALKLRPGLDGVCEDGRCLTPWQLVMSDSFSENHPLSAVPDLSFGFSASSVRRSLGSPQRNKQRGVGGLLRIETESMSADASGVHRLIRTRATPPALSRLGVAQALASAQRYILAAQEPDGSFRYTLDPATGAADNATMNFPRQAGTTYALCELGSGPDVKGAVSRALRVFSSGEQNFGEVSALTVDGDLGLGRSALPLLAMLRCRALAGAENDRLIGQLSRLMLRLQRENGSFFPALDPSTKRGVGEHEILYAAGQAVLALVLLEQQLPQLAGSAAEPLPSPARVKAALDRAMAYYGGPYWPRPLRDFFFFEEGWHCLAARTALSSHRSDAYENLCLDYVASRLRFVARASDTSEPHFVGGYGVSDLFPPRNTATSGLGEALDASLSIKLARGLPLAADQALLRDLMAFLLRAQWTEAGCFACKDPAQVLGGFSQMLASPGIRIDYVQHAMAALGQGAKLLELR
jgi:hypothetical protein